MTAPVSLSPVCEAARGAGPRFRCCSPPEWPYSGRGQRGGSLGRGRRRQERGSCWFRKSRRLRSCRDSLQAPPGAEGPSCLRESPQVTSASDGRGVPGNEPFPCLPLPSRAARLPTGSRGSEQAAGCRQTTSTSFPGKSPCGQLVPAGTVQHPFWLLEGKRPGLELGWSASNC